jgi:hypothetical protein
MRQPVEALVTIHRKSIVKKGGAWFMIGSPQLRGLSGTSESRSQRNSLRSFFSNTTAPNIKVAAFG